MAREDIKEKGQGQREQGQGQREQGQEKKGMGQERGYHNPGKREEYGKQGKSQNQNPNPNKGIEEKDESYKYNK